MKSRIKQFYFILLLIPILIISQEDGLNKLYIVDQGSILPNEIIRDIPDNYDVNGKLAAGLLIVSDLSGLSYSSNNGILKEVERGAGQDLLYLSPTESLVTIFNTGFEPLELVLNDIGIELSSGKVWQIKVSGDKSALDSVLVNFIIEPRKSNLMINDLLMSKHKNIFMKYGEYKIKITCEGYDTLEDTIVVNAKNTLFELALKHQSFKSEFIYVEGGDFLMGNTNGDIDENFVHKVSIQGFFISNSEVTNSQYITYCQENGLSSPKVEKEFLDYPISNITWEEANAYCKWLGGRLPTEAEWEYAAQGGMKTNDFKFSGSNNLDKVGWFGANSSGAKQEVANKEPNELGIYDMSGNVNEWCMDWYLPNYYANSEDRGRGGPEYGMARVIRGGNYVSERSDCTNYRRFFYTPNYRSNLIGFRVVLDRTLQGENNVQ